MNCRLRSVDVFVVGGGPAGLAAAIAARQRGLRVLIADCARLPIDKACGEGLMPDALAALRALGVTTDENDGASFRGIRFIGAGTAAEANFPSGWGRGIRRTTLHELLVRRARELQVSLAWGARVSLAKGRISLDGEPVRCRWLIGADGQNSQVRALAGLGAGYEYDRRFGWRRHYRVPPWNDFVEIHWAEDSQLYITPTAGSLCVALITRNQGASYQSALESFAAVADRLRGSECVSAVRGAVTVSRQLKAVSAGHVALIGDAAGSVDAITGMGLGLAFRQALALADGLCAGDLSRYEWAHRQILRLPHLIGRSMLMMDKNPVVCARALRAFAATPELFQRVLSVHVGEISMAEFLRHDLPAFAWGMLAA